MKSVFWCLLRSLFPSGAGELSVFCGKGRQLVRALQSKTASLLAAFHTGQHQRVRRISRSEGDLRIAFAPLNRRLEAQHQTPPNSLPDPRLVSIFTNLLLSFQNFLLLAFIQA
jgi:hypothetical protein